MSKKKGLLPNFIIIGAMRSGTTSLARLLGMHEQIFMTRRKEVHFFDDHFEKGVEWYRKHFVGGDGRVVGEATPSYMLFPEISERIATVCPDAKLIAILRNPIDRAYSHYWMNRSLRRETLDFASTIDQERQRAENAERRVIREYSYMARGFYAIQLRRFQDVFQRESIHVILFEEFVTNVQEAAKSVYNFLEVDQEKGGQTEKRFNQALEYRSVGLRNFGRKLPSLLNTVIGKVNSRKLTYPPMDPEIRERLSRLYYPHNQELSEWLGRDLSIWK